MMRMTIIGAMSLLAAAWGERTSEAKAKQRLYLDVHELGKVSAADVAAAHKKDLATQRKHGVAFKSYWVDEKEGKVYCLAEAPSADALAETHKEAHGLVPKTIMEVMGDNLNWTPAPGKKLFLDVHTWGPARSRPRPWRRRTRRTSPPRA